METNTFLMTNAEGRRENFYIKRAYLFAILPVLFLFVLCTKDLHSMWTAKKPGG